MNQEITNIIAVACIFVIIFIIAELLRKTNRFSPEGTRKFVHFSGAAISSFFPFIFKSHISILILVLSFGLIMFLSKKFNMLKSIHNIDRKSEGAVYLPISVYLCFIFAQIIGQPYFYVISILILAISDAFAALIGKTYGIRPFIVEIGQNKSMEGSGTFFVTAFLITHLILLLFTSTGRIECVLTAVLVALILTIIEGLSIDGTDNIFVPVGAIVILSKSASAPPQEILTQIIYMLLFLGAFLVLLRPYTKIGFSGIVLSALTAYLSLNLGGWEYSLAIVLVAFLCQKTKWILIADESKNEIFRTLPVFYISIVPIMWLLGADVCRAAKIADLHTAAFIPFVYCLIAQMSAFRGWKRKLEKGVIPMVRCSLKKATVFTLFFTPILWVLFKESIIIPAASCAIAAYFTDRIYWYFAVKHEAEWQHINYLKTGFYLTLAFSVIIFLVHLGETHALYIK